MTKSEILKGAIASGVINGIINGMINWFQLDKSSTISLTTDSISSQEYTVFGEAVVLGTSLAFILTSIAFFTIKIENKPSYFPSVFSLALKNTIFVFGVLTIFALLFQRIFGEIEVHSTSAAIITGIVAGVASIFIDFSTKSTLVLGK